MRKRGMYFTCLMLCCLLSVLTPCDSGGTIPKESLTIQSYFLDGSLRLPIRINDPHWNFDQGAAYFDHKMSLESLRDLALEQPGIIGADIYGDRTLYIQKEENGGRQRYAIISHEKQTAEQKPQKLYRYDATNLLLSVKASRADSPIGESVNFYFPIHLIEAYKLLGASETYTLLPGESYRLIEGTDIEAVCAFYEDVGQNSLEREGNTLRVSCLLEDRDKAWYRGETAVFTFSRDGASSFIEASYTGQE